LSFIHSFVTNERTRKELIAVWRFVPLALHVE
jgi:hypothetical protein